MSTFSVAAITYVVDIHTSCMYRFKVALLATLRGGSKIFLDIGGIHFNTPQTCYGGRRMYRVVNQVLTSYGFTLLPQETVPVFPGRPMGGPYSKTPGNRRLKLKTHVS